MLLPETRAFAAITVRILAAVKRCRSYQVRYHPANVTVAVLLSLGSSYQHSGLGFVTNSGGAV